MYEYRATIVAVGSELLSGQITNRNAAWLSERATDLGLDVRAHYTVDDVESDIIQVLDEAAGRGAYVFVTGGLGPTTDDLTRQSVAHWAHLPLEWDPASWTHCEKIFQRFKLPTPDSNKQQCFFPQGSAVLTNRAGTANAFALDIGKKTRVFVLPGPPREVEVIWEDHIAPSLRHAVPTERRREVRMWRTIGRGESHVGELVESLAKDSGAEIAYRAHAPYVETKLRFPTSEAQKFVEVCARLDTALAPWLYETDKEDVARALVRRALDAGSVNIYDGAGNGAVAELLAPAVREETEVATQLSIATSWEDHDTPDLFVRNCLAINDHVELVLAVAGFDSGGEWAVGVKSGTDIKVTKRQSPYKGEALRSRNQKAVAWLAVRAWYDALTRSTH